MSELLNPVSDSLEARWFFSGPLAPEASEWFERLGPPVSPDARADRYLIPAESDDLGLKVREGTVQAKQRTGTLGLRPLAPPVAGEPPAAVGRIESWRKWTLGTAEHTPEAGWVDVAKVRRQRALVLLAHGARCALELSEIQVGDSRWWSVCLEASGAGPDARWMALRAASRRWLTCAPPLAAEASMGYPAWLRREAE